MPFKQQQICCVSDIHIGVHQNSNMWHKITLDWALWLKKELQAKKIVDIMISGDFFHYRDEISVNTIHVASMVLDIWKDFNIVMLVGNHDAYYKERSDVNSLSLFKGRSNVHVYDQIEQVTTHGVDVVFAPWGTAVDQIPTSDIIFGHFEINSFKMNGFKVCDGGVGAEELLKRCDLVITGHFHLRDERCYETGTVIYTGNPFQMDFGDRGSTKGYYLLDLPTQEYVYHNNDVSPVHKKIKLSELVEFGDITDEVRKIFKGNIIRIIFDKNISTDEVDILMKVLLSLNPLMLTVDYENTFNNLNLHDDDQTDLSGVDMTTAIKEFIQMLDVDDKDDIINQTLAIYNNCK